jgi:subtilisin family serine protease
MRRLSSFRVHLCWTIVMLIVIALPVPSVSGRMIGEELCEGSMPPKQETQSGTAIQLRTGRFVPSSGEELALPDDLEISGYPEGEAGYYLVQFKGPIKSTWKTKVENLGATFLEYIPDFAFIVCADPSVTAAVEALPEVVWLGPFQPAYKINPELQNAAGTVDLLVLAFPTDDVTSLVQKLRLLGAEITEASDTKGFGHVVRLNLDALQLEKLANIPSVHSIEPYVERVLFNDVARGASIMAAEPIWSGLGLYGQGQIVAVTDTGLDTGDPSSLHQDFLGSPTGCSGTDRIVATFARGTPGDWSDSCQCRDQGKWYNEGGHGTHVSGSVLGNGCASDSAGTPDYAGSHAGLAPQAGLVMQSVMGNRGFNCNLGGCGLTGIPSDLNVLFSEAEGARASIHTNSWGSDANGQYTIDARNTDVYSWINKGYTILFSAGNAGIDANSDGIVDLDSMGSPATAKNCITVGASENYRLQGGVNPSDPDSPWTELQCTGDPGICSEPPAPYWGNCWPNDYRASPVCPDRLSDNAEGIVAFSSRGPCDDGRIKPDVLAPGSNILSTRSQGEYVSGGWGAGENDYYQFMGGTSMATPLTAGGVALIRGFFTDIQGLAPTSALIKATLIHGATDLYPGQYGTGPTQEIPSARPNNVEGWGRVNLEDSLLPSGSRRIEYFDYYGDSEGRLGLQTDEYDGWTYDVTDGTVPFMSTLVWTDYPASTTSAVQLVNDLDLTATGPGSIIYYPNRLLSYDRTNNVEHIDLSGGIVSGQYEIMVEAHNVTQGGSPPRQPYAVVDSGIMGHPISASSYREFSSGDEPNVLFGKTGIELDFVSVPIGGGNVTITMNKTPPAEAAPSGTTFLNVNWDISTVMSGFSTRLVFHYDEADLPAGMPEGGIFEGAYRWNGSSWDFVSGVLDTVANTVTVDNVTALSSWALGGPYPTAVELVGFQAVPTAGGIRVEWETANELDILGFHLYRRLAPDGERLRLNDDPIPAAAPGSPVGASYTWLDEEVVPGTAYVYTLESIDFHGRADFAAEASAIAPFVQYLPLITRP